MSDAQAKAWLSRTFELAGPGSNFIKLPLDKKVNVLREGWQDLHGKALVKQDKKFISKAHIGSCGHKADMVFANNVDSSSDYAVVGCSLCEYGWLVLTKKPGEKPKDTVAYDERYFEGESDGLGYGNYLAQEPWRVEKAYGQIRQIKSAAAFLGLDLGKGTRLLDVGSGYGFLRKAAKDAFWHNDGIEASNFAAKICKQRYGLKTFIGDLHTFAKAHKGKGYDVIALADVLEHVGDPIAELKAIKGLLNKKGLCMIRTPSITSVEAGVFGNSFYSLKREHLHYFSPRSVSLFAYKAGLAPSFVVTHSHFFQGLLGQGIRVHEATGQGSDIFALLQKIE